MPSANAGQLVLTISVRRWVRWYLSALILFSRTFGVSPDEGKVVRFIVRYGVKIAI